MENTIIYSITAIFILSCVCIGIQVFKRKNKNNGEEDIYELIKEYTGLIVSLVNSSLEIVKVDSKAISLEDYKNQIAILVSNELFNELNSDDMDNELIKKLIKTNIINVNSLTDVLLKLFDIVGGISDNIKTNFDKKQKDLEIES